MSVYPMAFLIAQHQGSGRSDIVRRRSRCLNQKNRRSLIERSKSICDKTAEFQLQRPIKYDALPRREGLRYRRDTDGMIQN